LRAHGSAHGRRRARGDERGTAPSTSAQTWSWTEAPASTMRNVQRCLPKTNSSKGHSCPGTGGRKRGHLLLEDVAEGGRRAGTSNGKIVREHALLHCLCVHPVHYPHDLRQQTILTQSRLGEGDDQFPQLRRHIGCLLVRVGDPNGRRTCAKSKRKRSEVVDYACPGLQSGVQPGTVVLERRDLAQARRDIKLCPHKRRRRRLAHWRKRRREATACTRAPPPITRQLAVKSLYLQGVRAVSRAD